MTTWPMLGSPIRKKRHHACCDACHVHRYRERRGRTRSRKRKEKAAWKAEARTRA